MDDASLIRYRLDAAATTAVATAVLALLAVRYHGVTGPDRWDLLVDAAVVSAAGAWSDALRPTILVLGPVGTTGICALLALVAAARRMWRCVALATAGPVACGAAVLLLQPAIGRTLNGGDALPSGHTTAAVCTAMVVLLVGPRLAGRRVPRVAGAPVVVAVTVIMGTTLITNGLHVPSDILAGAVAGVAGVLSTAFLIDRIAERQHAKGPRISD